MTDYNHEITPAGSSERKPARICPRSGHFWKDLRDDVGEKLVFEAGDFVFKAKLTLF